MSNQAASGHLQAHLKPSNHFLFLFFPTNLLSTWSAPDEIPTVNNSSRRENKRKTDPEEHRWPIFVKLSQISRDWFTEVGGHQHQVIVQMIQLK